MTKLKIAFAALLLSVSPISIAADYPTKPVRIIVPFAPGGGSDTMARIISTELAKSLGQSVVVENKPGAAGMLATAYVAASPADGYTLLLADVPFTANLAVYSKPSYKLDEFEPVATIATVPVVVVVGPHVSVKSLAELTSQAKDKPGTFNMASGGAGGVAHLQGAQFAHAAGIEWVHVPYRGMGPAAVDVIGGQADVLFASAPTVVGHIKAERLKAVAVTSKTRSMAMPDVPTFAELGYPQLTADNWFGLVAPAKTDPAIVKKLHEQVNAAVKTQSVQALLTAQMATGLSLDSPKDFGDILKRDTEKWAGIVKATHITAN